MTEITDWTKRLDLNRTTITTDFVKRMEECMRQQEAAAADLKELTAQAAEQEFTKRDIEAMKRIARLRLKDQVGRAREQIDALRRIGDAVQCDLFSLGD
jgi:uncharacterized protein (UPF0335 family)